MPLDLQQKKDLVEQYGDGVAASPHVFFNPAAVQQEQHESGETGDMLALRVGTRTCIFSEEVRVTGPECARSAPGSVSGPAIQMGSFRIRSIEEEYDLGAWYAGHAAPAALVIAALLGFGFLTALAGQPLFRDPLEETDDSRG